MATRYIRAPRLNQHVLITPVSTVRDARLSYRARGVLARLLSNADGFYMTAEDLATEGREGRDAIRAALRELRAAGYLLDRHISNAQGQFNGTDVYVYDTPCNEASHNREPENPLAGSPPAGVPPLKSSKNIIEEKCSSTHAVDVSQQGCRAATGRKVRHQRQSGIVWYEPDDSLTDVERIETSYGVAEIAAAVGKVHPGKQPVPGVVERLILKHRQQVTADADYERELADQRRRALTPCEDPETAARKAMEQMAAYVAEATK